MSNRLPEQFVDEVLARTDIVEVISARVPLKKAGREWRACCPFHDEKSPSFYVSPIKQFYHCFGCGAHGTAVGFLMQFDRLGFVDALEDLAKQVGIELPKGAQSPRDDSSPLYEVLEQAARFFATQLKSSEVASNYALARGLDAGTLERFQIGFAPDAWDGLMQALGTSAQGALLRAGMLSSRDSGGSYDKFRKRLMFPIKDRRGRVIAFGGRVIDPADSPKYLNSPETPLFYKSRELYGLHEARHASPKLERLLVVEGYMDVVSLAQFGVVNSVATLGTATSADHAELLFRSAPEVVFCFDGDRAGRAAAWKALEAVMPRLRDGRQARFLFLPDGEDPDSLVRQEGALALNRRLESAMPLSDYFFEQFEGQVDMLALDGRAKLVELARPLLNRAPDSVFRDLMFERLQERAQLKRPLNEPAAPLSHKPSKRLKLPADQPSIVRKAMVCLLNRPNLALLARAPDRFATLEKPGVALLSLLLKAIENSPTITVGGLLEKFSDSEHADSLRKLATAELLIDPAQLDPEFLGALQLLNREADHAISDRNKAALASGRPTAEALRAAIRPK